MDWLEVVIVVDDASPQDGELPSELTSRLLEPFVAPDGGIACEQRGDPDDPNPTALMAETWVKAYLPIMRDSAELRSSILSTLHVAGLPAPSFQIVREQDWAEAWKTHYQPFRVGRHIWIYPSWTPVADHTPNDIVITLDPGMAFGTGTHPTTQLCLAMLEDVIRPNDDVLDLGTGSGILAIAAVRLGAGQVLAVDTDDEAIRATRENATINQVTVETLTGSLDIVPQQPRCVVVANILTPILVDLLEKEALLSHVADDGYLILSGILAEQEPTIAHAVQIAGGVIERVALEGDWIALLVRNAER